MKKILLILFLFNFCFSALGENRVFIVKENLINCVGLIERKCMLVKEEGSKNWKYFYDNIEGFKYQEGYRYKLLIKIVRNKNILQDGSSKKYKLIKILEKLKPKK